PSTRPWSPSRAPAGRLASGSRGPSAATTSTTRATDSSTTAARRLAHRKLGRSASTISTTTATERSTTAARQSPAPTSCSCSTCNWFFVDGKDIGYQHSCKCPQRAPGVDPYLPVWGTGEWDWQGFIPLSAQPNDLNPPAGFLTSWNNKQAPQFRSNDRQFSYGPVFRSQMLDVRIRAAITAGPIDRADLVDAMGDAGTVDLRGQEDLPLLLQVLGPTAPTGSDPRSQDMRDRLATWATTQTHRRDRDHDGAYDDPQSPAIMDAWWPRLAHAMFDSASGAAIGSLELELDDANRMNHVGSAFDDAFYSHPDKDLRQVLGLPVTDPWSRT